LHPCGGWPAFQADIVLISGAAGQGPIVETDQSVGANAFANNNSVPGIVPYASSISIEVKNTTALVQLTILLEIAGRQLT